MNNHFYKNKLVVVTGGSGFIGTHFVKNLLEQGARIRVPIHTRNMIIEDPKIELVKADLSCQNDCRKVFVDADYVIHAAGAVSAAGVTTGNNPMSAITANLNLTANILEAAWTQNVKRVLVFGSSTGYPESTHPIKEEEMWSAPPHEAYFGYGWMRRYLEVMSQFVSNRSSTQVAIVRPTATYGPHDDFNLETCHVIPSLIRRALDKENPFVVWGTGNEVRDFLHVSDLIEGSLLVLEKQANCNPINIGYGQHTTIKELVQIIINSTGHLDCQLEFDPNKPTTIPVRMVDTSKAKKLIGFMPKISLKDGIENTVKWYTSTTHQTISA